MNSKKRKPVYSWSIVFQALWSLLLIIIGLILEFVR